MAKSAQLPEIYRWQGRDSEKNAQMTSSRPFILVPFFSKRASAYRCALSFLLSILRVGAFSCCTYLISLVVDCGPDESFSRGWICGNIFLHYAADHRAAARSEQGHLSRIWAASACHNFQPLLSLYSIHFMRVRAMIRTRCVGLVQCSV